MCLNFNLLNVTKMKSLLFNQIDRLNYASHHIYIAFYGKNNHSLPFYHNVLHLFFWTLEGARASTGLCVDVSSGVMI